MDNISLFLLKILARLPLKITHALGFITGWIFWILPNKKKRITRINLDRCFPAHTADWKNNIGRKSLIETGKAILELPSLMVVRDPLRHIMHVTGEHNLKLAIDSGKGVVLAIPHLGNWEMVGLYCSSKYPMTSLYRPQNRQDKLNNFIRNGRERMGAKLVPTDVSGIRSLYSALGNGEIVAILPDQNPGAGTGVFAPFFGVLANTMIVLSRLATKSKAVVIYAYAERLPWGHGFNLHFIPAPEGIINQDMESSVTALNQGLEQCILRNPEQYWWSYTRFRVRPPGEPPIY